METIHQDAKLRLALQIALLDMVTKNIKVVSCRFVGRTIQIRTVFDGAVSDDDRERMEEVASEVIAHFPEVSRIETLCESNSGGAVPSFGEDWLVVFSRFPEGA